MKQLSELHFYSLALVSANKLLSSKDIECTPIENTSMLDGEITDTATDIIAVGKDASSANYGTNIKGTVSIKATWLPISNSNRMTAPDVRRGELVILYRFADTDKFWWQVFRNDMNLRKLETVTYAFSGTTVETDPTTADNSYFVEVSTHGKYIHLHTSNANGEPYQYDIQINTATGFIMLQDDQGNYIRLDTPEHQISLVNQDGSIVEVNKTNINLTCTDTINMSCSDLVVKASSSITGSTSKTTLNSPATTINGKVKINGGLSVK